MEMIGAMASDAVDNLTQALDSFGSIVNDPQRGTVKLVNDLGDAMSTINPILGTVFSTSLNFILESSLVQANLGALDNVLDALASTAAEGLQPAFDDLFAALSDPRVNEAMGQISSALGSLYEAAKPALSLAWDVFLDFLEDGAKLLNNVLSDPAVAEAFSTLADEFTRAYNALSPLLDLGWEALERTITGVTRAITTFHDTIRVFWDWLTGNISNNNQGGSMDHDIQGPGSGPIDLPPMVML